MAALSAPRNTPERVGYANVYPLAAETTVYQGSLVVVEGGFLKPGRTATGLTAVGRAERTASAVAAGDDVVEVRPGVFPWDNSSGADSIAQDDVEQLCYVVDDHTVALTSASDTRSVAGRIKLVDDAGVWVDTRPNP